MEVALFLLTADRPGSSLHSACRWMGLVGCTCCGSPGVWSPHRGVRSEPPRPWVCFPTYIRGNGQWGLPGPANSSLPHQDGLGSRMLPVFGNWVDFTGLQKETNHLSVSWNAHRQPVGIKAKMALPRLLLPSAAATCRAVLES